MYILATRFREPTPDPTIYKCIGEAVCDVCGVGYHLHLRIEEPNAAEHMEAVKLRFVEFLSHSVAHHEEHLPVIPVAVGLGDS